MKNFKYLLLVLSMAMFLMSCTVSEESAVRGAEEELVPISLNIGLDRGFQTGSALEPMTKAESYSTYINTWYDCLILKKIGNDWVVHKTLTPSITGLPTGNVISGSQQLVSDYRIELLPGDYHMLIVLNNTSGMNKNLIPGYRIPAHAPKAVGYWIVTKEFGRPGAVNLKYEIFAGSAQFKVTKTGQLEESGTPIPVDITTTRRVGTVGIYLKENSFKGLGDWSVLEGLTIFRVTAKEGAFCEGIDVFGEPYYSETPMTEFYGNYNISRNFAPSSKGNYYFPVAYTRIGGHFFFTETGANIPITVNDVDISVKQSPNLRFVYNDTEIEGTLSHNGTCHLTFTASDNYNDGDVQIYPEYSGDDALNLFPPDFMWTTGIK